MHDQLPDDSPHAGNRIWRRVRFLVVILSLGMITAIGATAAWLSARNAAAERQAVAAIALLESQGLPRDNASLVAYHDRLNSTQDLDEWLQVLSTVDSSEFKQSAKLLYPWNAMPPPAPGEQWADHAAALAFLSEWNQLIERAQRLSQADIMRRMPLNFDGPNTKSQWYGKVQQLACLFQLQAADGIYRRDSTQTCHAILNLLGCARSMEGQPLIVGQLMSIAIEAQALEQLQRAVELNVLAATELQRLKNRIEMRTPWQKSWQIGIHGELATLLPVFDAPARYLGSHDTPLVTRLPWHGRDKLALLEIATQNLELPVSDLTAFRDANRQLNETVETRFRRRHNRLSLDETLCAYLLPAFGAYGDALLQREMRCRLSVLGLAVREYQATYGKLPDTLADLKQIGTDLDELTPPGSKPFGFRKLDASVALWGFPARTLDSTPDDKPNLPAANNSWDRMWLWQLSTQAGANSELAH